MFNSGQFGLVPGMQRCGCCKEVKPLSEFYKNHKVSKRSKRECKACSQRKIQNNRDLKLYGMTTEEIEAWSLSVGHRCEICEEREKQKRNGKVIRLCVDHNHETGEVRGLLCNICNKIIGLLKENPNMFYRVDSYLYKYNHKEV